MAQTSLANALKILASAAILLLPAHPAFAQTSDSLTKPVADLNARGVIGGKLTSDLHTDTVPSPPAGVEVDEYHADRVGGAQNGEMQAWNEPFGDDTLHIEVGHRADGAAMASWWVLPKSTPGCLVYVYKIFEPSGRVARSEYWSRTNIVKTTSGTDFPAQMYPFGPNGGMPANEMIRALDPIQPGASGKLYTQYTFDGYVILDVWADRVENVTVPAGTFKALHLAMRPNPSPFLPSWPGFVLKVIDQFMPRESFYFEANPPYRFLKYEGVPGANGPEVSTELVRYWIAVKSDGRAISSSR